MIDPTHLLEHIIRPVLKDLDLWSPQAERLVLGTACKESECGRWLVQLGGGPALGIYQMEPATHNDIWENFLVFPGKTDLRNVVKKYMPQLWTEQQLLIGNLYYATALCRIHYLRVPEPIPDDLPRQAAYWKRFYNSEKGAGTVQEYIEAWRRFVPAGVV